jgi:hypothetical protein
MQIHRVTTSALFVFLALPGCSDADSVGVESFKEAYPEAYCARHFRCCAASQSERLYPSETNCEGAATVALEELLAFTEDPTAAALFMEDVAGSCLSRLGSRDCSSGSELSLHGCMQEVVQPLQAEGEPCMFSIECQSYYCVKSDPEQAGTCGAGGSTGCSGDHRACGPVSYCDINKCVPKKEAGDSCAVSAECQSNVCSPELRICVNTPTPRCDGT